MSNGLSLVRAKKKLTTNKRLFAKIESDGISSPLKENFIFKMACKNFVDDYFDKFKDSGKKNFGQLSRYLSQLSEKKCDNVIKVGSVTIPNYVPDSRLAIFANLLRPEEGWKREEIEEVNGICRAYLGVQFKNDQECLGMLEMMNKLAPDKNYDALIAYFTVDGVDLDTDVVIDMMSDCTNPINPLIASYILTSEVNDMNPFE